MGKVKKVRTSSDRTDTGYIRKLCHSKYPGINIKQSTLDDLDALANEVFDQIAREAAELLRLNTPSKSTLTVREMDTQAKLIFSPDLYKQVNTACTNAVLKFASFVKPEPQ
jgi:hypothetical protein